MNVCIKKCKYDMIHDMMTFGYKIPKCVTFDTTYSVVL